jgi:hypothetical protein
LSNHLPVGAEATVATTPERARAKRKECIEITDRVLTFKL